MEYEPISSVKRLGILWPEKQMLPFPQFVTGKVTEAVVGGVFVHFAERRVIKDLVDELVDGKSVVENHHADVDQFCSALADDAEAE